MASFFAKLYNKGFPILDEGYIIIGIQENTWLPSYHTWHKHMKWGGFLMQEKWSITIAEEFFVSRFKVVDLKTSRGKSCWGPYLPLYPPSGATMKLSGRTVLVAGGTSGIVLGIADVFHRCGSRVIVCGRDRRRLSAVEEKLPGTAALPCDVGDGLQRKTINFQPVVVVYRRFFKRNSKIIKKTPYIGREWLVIWAIILGVAGFAPGFFDPLIPGTFRWLLRFGL
jgi:hypothetical protein